MDNWIWFAAAVATALIVGGCRTTDASAVDYKQLISEGATLVFEATRSSPRARSRSPCPPRPGGNPAKDEPVVPSAALAVAPVVKKLLESEGWTQVYNAGGLSDLKQ